MKRLTTLALPLMAACVTAAPPIHAGWTTEGFDAPESAYVDLASNAIYVSNVGGSPGEKDGKGWISKLDFSGKVLKARWVDGLNAPKGLRAHGGTLWCADIDEIVSIDIYSGTLLAKVKVADAKFLNDVACGPDGAVYVSDMALSRIYVLKAGKLEVFADGPDLEHPNGLLVEGDSLVVGGWGIPEADFSTKVPGRLYKLDLATKKKTLITPIPLGNLDGVESDGQGGYVVTDWIAGKVFRVGSDGAHRLSRQFAKGAADHSYVALAGVLILPHMMENKVGSYALK